MSFIRAATEGRPYSNFVKIIISFVDVSIWIMLFKTEYLL